MLGMYDVIVVGAGPIGSYAALRLAELGYQVIVLEQKEEPGENICCTGIVSAECLDTFNLDAAILREVKSARFFAPCGQFIRFEREDLRACIIDTAGLDRALIKRAQSCGADCLFSARVVCVSPETDHVSVTADYCGEQKIITARIVVLACGMECQLPEELGMGRITSFAIGAQAEVNTNINEVEVYLDQNLFPGFFGWLVPTSGDSGLAGLITPESPALYLGKFLDNLRAQGKIASAEVDRKFGKIPLGTLPRSSGERILAVGDAAGQVKPTTGGGIYLGLLCTDIAVKCLDRAFSLNDFSSARLSEYDKQWRARLGSELKVGYRMRRFYHKINNRRIDHLFKVAQGDGVAELIAEWPDFSFDWHGALVSEVGKHLAVAAALQPLRGLLRNSNR